MNTPDFTNSRRVSDLIRAGNLYLSLADAISLAIENNLDVQVERYQLPIAATDLLRAKGGGTLRGVSLTVVELPSGVGGPASPLLTLAATGTTPSTSVPNNIYDLALLSTTATTLSLAPDSPTSPLPSATGPPIPQYDPVLTGNLNWNRAATPEANSLVAGASVLRSDTTNYGLNLQQGFSPGTQYSFGFNGTTLNENSLRNNYNPYSTGSLGLTVTQPLLRGFGIALNRRWITIAKNDQRISDAVFRQQLINVVFGISDLYYDLVGLYEDLRVKQQTLEAAHALHDNTKSGIDEGTLAPVELTRADAEVAGAEQDLINSQGLFDQQEAIVKNVLTRRGGRDPAIQHAHLIPTETLVVPQTETIPTVAELLPEALARRPDLQQARLQLTNSSIALKGSRNELLPELDLVGAVQTNGLTGVLNPNQSTTSVVSGVPGPDPTLIGGYGNLLSQLFAHRYPVYEVGIQLSLPLRNRTAQADVMRDELSLHAYQTRFEQLQNQAELEIEAAIIGLRRARASYDAAVRTRILQAQSLDVEQARFAEGVSTAFFVIQYQSYYAQSQSTEVVARENYFKARAALDRALGASLDVHHVSIDDAYRGVVNK